MPHLLHGAGLGLRRGALMDALETQFPTQIDFLEVAPENWLGLGGRLGKRFRQFSEAGPIACHGLSLNIGGFAALDQAFLKRLKQFFKHHNIICYSDHLSYCGDEGHLYDLMPIPFTEEAIKHVAHRIKQTQDILEQRIAMENVSYYAAPGQEMSEIDFINAVIAEADCDLLLDVNNIYVNSINHGYDAETFLKALPGERIVYGHIAGHYNEAKDLIVDTHGADIIDPVWRLLHVAFTTFGVFPTLLERDFNIPPLPDLLKEIDTIARIQQQHSPDTCQQAAVHA